MEDAETTSRTYLRYGPGYHRKFFFRNDPVRARISLLEVNAAEARTPMWLRRTAESLEEKTAPDTSSPMGQRSVSLRQAVVRGRW